MGISDADLAGVRTTVNSFLPNLGTVARTSTIYQCRVNDTGRDVQPTGLPTFSAERLWRLTFPNGSDVTFGDAVTVTGLATYTVLMAGISSYSPAVTVYGVIAGATEWDTTQATFTDTGVSPRIPTPPQNVLIYEAAKDAQIAPEAARYRWAVAFPASLRYSNGDQVSAGDLINWSALPGGSASLSKPRPNNDPRNPLLIAYFGET